MTDSTELFDKLAQLQRQFQAQLPQRLQEIRELWARASAVDGSGGELSVLHRKVHSLIGSAGTYGAQAVSLTARELEAVLLASLSAQQPLARENIASLLTELEDVAATWEPNGVPLIPRPQPSAPDSDMRLIDLVDDDAVAAQELRRRLEAAGYRVRQHARIADFLDQAAEQAPAAVIMDMACAEGDVAGVIQRLRQQTDSDPKAIFISLRADSEAKLAAVRAGAHRYLVKPVDSGELLQILDGLTERVSQTPFRVMIVDDEEAVADRYAELLRQHGMDVLTLSEPMRTLALMEKFHPELLLLDVYMPECNGLELAAMVRLDDGYANMPIVFLSAEADLGRQMVAMHLGGDDFLVKPVDPVHLVEAVTARLRRTRWINRLHSDLQNALRDSRYRHVALYQHAPLCIVDRSGRLNYVNDKFCRATARSRTELIGKPFEPFGGEEQDPASRQIREQLGGGEVWQGELSHSRGDGGLFWADSTVVPFLDEKGAPYQYVAVMTDVTARKAAEQELEQARARLAHALSSNPVVLYDLRIENGELKSQWISDNVGEVFGCRLEQALEPNWWGERLHPEDRARVIGRLDELASGDSLVQEYRFRHGSGAYLWINDRLTLKRDRDGVVTDILGAWTDVSSLRNSQQALSGPQGPAEDRPAPADSAGRDGGCR